MSAILNMIVVEPKQNNAPQNANNKGSATSDKSTLGFAKTLTTESDKNDVDVDSKVKSDDTTQLMAGMMGMIVPVIINVVPPVDQIVSNASNVLEKTMNLSQVQLDNVIPVAPQVELASTAVPVLSQTEALPVIPIPSQLTAAMSRASGLATLLSQGQGTATNVKMENTQLGQFSQLQAQAQLQNKTIVAQSPILEISKENMDMLSNNSILSSIAPIVATINDATGLVKKGSQQSDGKKIVTSQFNAQAMEVANEDEVVIAANGTSIVTPQAMVTVVGKQIGEGNVSMLLGGEKEITTDMPVPNQSAKNTDVFASLLNQQGMQIENQSTVEAKPVPSQSAFDPYNVTSQIVDQARLVAGAKNTEMIIQLKPEHLGELTFKVSVENGVVSASFHSNNPEVRSIIESSLYQLKQEMTSQGLKIDNVGVYAGLGQFSSNGQQSGTNQQPVVKSHNKKVDEEFIEAFDATDSSGKILNATGVDYRA